MKIYLIRYCSYPYGPAGLQGAFSSRELAMNAMNTMEGNNSPDGNYVDDHGWPKYTRWLDEVELDTIIDL